MITHYGLFREIAPSSPMIKEADFFVEQGGLKEDWGKKWEPIEDAASIGDARRMMATKYGIKLSPIYSGEE